MTLRAPFTERINISINGERLLLIDIKRVRKNSQNDQIYLINFASNSLIIGTKATVFEEISKQYLQLIHPLLYLH